jgi:hypothetical protein
MLLREEEGVGIETWRMERKERMESSMFNGAVGKRENEMRRGEVISGLDGMRWD